MPYNTNSIPRPEEITGTSSLPLARVKKIIAQDEDIAQCSNGAAFAISVATEEFLRYLTEQAYNVTKSESKPRRNLAYKDIATAISKIDNLQFLSDTVPRTLTYKQVKDQESASASRKTKTPNTNGNSAATYDDVDNDDLGDEIDQAPSRQRNIGKMMSNGTADRSSGTRPADGTPKSPGRGNRKHSMASSPIIDRSARLPPASQSDTRDGNIESDTEMQD